MNDQGEVPSSSLPIKFLSQSRKLGRAGWVVTETRSGPVSQSRKLGRVGWVSVSHGNSVGRVGWVSVSHAVSDPHQRLKYRLPH